MSRAIRIDCPDRRLADVMGHRSNAGRSRRLLETTAANIFFGCRWRFALRNPFSGGGGGIRTHGGLSPSLVFKTSAFDHSATPPGQVLPSGVDLILKDVE